MKRYVRGEDGPRAEELCPFNICAVLSPLLARCAAPQKRTFQNFPPVNPSRVCPPSLPAGLSASCLQHRQWANPSGIDSDRIYSWKTSPDGARSPGPWWCYDFCFWIPLSLLLSLSLFSCCSRAVASRPIDGACSLSLRALWRSSKFSRLLLVL